MTEQTVCKSLKFPTDSALKVGYIGPCAPAEPASCCECGGGGGGVKAAGAGTASDFATARTGKRWKVRDLTEHSAAAAWLEGLRVY